MLGAINSPNMAVVHMVTRELSAEPNHTNPEMQAASDCLKTKPGREVCDPVPSFSLNTFIPHFPAYFSCFSFLNFSFLFSLSNLLPFN